MRHCVFVLCLFCVLPTPWVWAAPSQQSFSDWQVTCNNQNFCVARNTGEHRGLVMTLSRSAGATKGREIGIVLTFLALLVSIGACLFYAIR